MHGLQADDRTPREVTIGYVGGGSTSWAHTLMNDLALAADLTGEVALYDVDHEAAKRNARFGNWVDDLPGAESDFDYVAYEDRDDALRDADFVVVSTQDDLVDQHADLLLPEEYGIYETVWDTVGPGGTVRAMRAVSQYREIAATVREVCPDAWVINYSNPMTMCVRTLYEEYPEVNAIGLCHEVFGTQGFFADLVGEYLDAETPPRHEIDLNVKGINHFTWADEARWRGRDLFDLLDRKLDEETPLPAFDPGDLDDVGHGANSWHVTLELYRRFGAVPAAADRHLVEFVPWFLDVDSREAVHRWGIRTCPTGFREGANDTFGEPLEQHDTPVTERYMSGEESFELSESGEESVEIIQALCGGDALKTNVNTANRGQVANLPQGAVVETNALVTPDSVTPLTAGDLPRQVRNAVMTHVENHETLVEAGFAGDLDLAFQAFLNEPLVTIQPDRARDLFAEMVEHYRNYFDGWDLEGAAVLD
jgi:alpha-galactosidase